MRKIINNILLILAGIVFSTNIYILALAETAQIDLGAPGELEIGENYGVDVSISGDADVGIYYVEIHYDSEHLTYVSGADEISPEGYPVLAGVGNGPQVGRRLVFQPKQAGDASISVGQSAVMVKEPVGEANFSISRSGKATVHINGENAEEQAVEPPEGQPAEEANENPLTERTEEAQVENPAENRVVEDNRNPEADADEEVAAVEEAEEVDDIAPKTIGTVLISEKARADEHKAVVFDEESYEVISQNDAFYSTNPINRFGYKYIGYTGTKLYLVLAAFVLLIGVIIWSVIRNLKDITSQSYLPDIEGDSSDYGLALEDRLVTPDDCQENDEDYAAPIISVRHVTKKYKIATSSVSGIKDYLIQRLKKQLNYRELLALDDVSFDVYKGEVVGIIGTNGSGKSTLLKIVSGALAPTSGEVVVDRRKIQLLTLGTGFDMELTARENVYLNGAIIGYTKEFLDEHYDAIVAFAELEGFMDEKVKNFSSGMVSRLGFAIATCGDAAEILILDEVLSVGDEFFRKKSLARVQEMIHGGSTVLIVSHSMDTIQKNCSKVVWIEKGKMQMVGDAQEVCEEYKKLGGS